MYYTDREMYTPAGNMAVYGAWEGALKVNRRSQTAEYCTALQVGTASLDWERLAGVKGVEVEGPLPKQAKLSPPDDNQLADRFELSY